ncbi:MAG: DUF262 domain-containing protein [Oscillospiraceae bacterium]|nr:DUF262 domain-containing protein [Oscillospiraceae bacterium]
MADTYIKYIDRSIASAFTDLYIVPDYQREYVWTDTQVEQLLSDLMEAYAADSKKAYFLGTIVTFDEGTRFELIDGQQRLTTFFILLCAIKHIYAQNNEKAGAIEKLIYSEVMNDYGDTVSQYHLQLQYEDAGNCLELIEKGEDKPKNITQSGERLFNAYNIILNTMEDKFSDFAELKKFVVFLLNKTSFIRIETYDITDALKIFETINQRGKGLDPMDLLKNMVFRQVDRSKFKELNMNWKAITTALEQIDEKPLRFLRYFIMANYDTSESKDGIIREEQIYSWLSANKAQCRYEEEPFKFVQKMKDNVDVYVKCRQPENNLNGNIHLKNIPMLAGKSYKLHLMLMLAASNMDEEANELFKKTIESVVYYTVIDKVATNVTERTFVLWCRRIRQIKTIEELQSFINEIIVPTVNEWKQDNEINFLRLGLNSMQQYRIKFILGKITAYVDSLRLGKDTVDSLEAYIPSAVEIEHIMPQTCPDMSAYDITEEEFNVYINRLGNLTLLENTLNKSIHNDKYDEKLNAYKQSRFYLTSAISELVNQGQNTAITRTNNILLSWSVWTKQSIEERQRMLYDLSERIWAFNDNKTD